MESKDSDIRVVTATATVSASTEITASGMVFDIGSEPTDEFSHACFLDILGFRNKITNVPDDEREYAENKMFTFLKTISTILDAHKVVAEEHKSLLLSDSIYLFYDLEEEQEILKLVSIIYFYGLANGIHYRGGISGKKVKNTRINDQAVFLGMAIIESYELENNYANYSRILCENVGGGQSVPELSCTDYDGYNYFDILDFTRNNYDDVKMLYNDRMRKINLQFGVEELKKFKININDTPASFDDLMKQGLSTIDDEIKELSMPKGKRVYSKFHLQKEAMKIMVAGDNDHE